MSALSDLQVELIRGNIRHGGIETVDLEDDLLDHICCAIENEMRQNTPFENALTKVKEAICPNGFKEIQQETTYLLTLKFKKMKKTMNILGTLGATLLMLGSVLKIQHWPGAGVCVVLGAGTLALLYLPFMLTMGLKQTDNWMSKLKHFAAYAAGTAVVLGILFKIQHWPGARIMLLGGLMSFVFIYLPLHLKFTARDAMLKIQPVTSAVLLFAACSLLFAFSNQTYSYVSSLSMANTANTLEVTANQAIKLNVNELSGITDPAILEVHKAATEATDYVQRLRTHLLSRYFKEEGVETTEVRADFAMLMPGERSLDFLLDQDAEYPDINGSVLKDKIEALNTVLHKHGVETSIDLSIQKERYGNEEGWLERQFSNKPAFAVFISLSQISLEISNAEGTAINLLVNNKNS